jgi:hypothetical protein
VFGGCSGGTGVVPQFESSARASCSCRV